MPLVLELNDAALSLHQDGRILYQQPAVAYLDGDSLSFGDAALKNARRHPQQANQQYLARLNADPLPNPGRQVANHADLVYRHLLELQPLAERPAIVAVPGFLAKEQLGVLLGIANEAGFEIRAFVDAALLMASAAQISPPAWLLDLHATRCCLTQLHGGEELSRGVVEPLTSAGLNSCLDGWANLAADRFVQDLRFDPLHTADTEQQLYDQLRAWSQSGGQTDLALEIQYRGAVRRTQLSRAALQDKLAQRLAAAAEKVPADAQLLVAPRSAALPGLLAALRSLGRRPEALPEDALSRAADQHANALNELKLVTTLPIATAAPSPQAAPPTATHALHEHRAWPLPGNPFGLPEQGGSGEVHERDGQRFRFIVVEDGP